MSRWFTVYDSYSDSAIRLFCFPCAGGGASMYRPWIQAAAEDARVVLLHLPGREQRIAEEPFRSIPALVSLIVSEMRQLLDAPFAFFGHSYGALVAFETARRLRACGLPGPSHLFLSGHAAPWAPSRRKPIHQLPDEEFLQEIRRFRGAPGEVWSQRELIDLLLPVLRADFEAVERYQFQPQAPLSCSLSAWAGCDDDDVNSEELASWRTETSGEFSARQFPGHHFYLTGSAAFLDALKKELRAITAGLRPPRA